MRVVMVTLHQLFSRFSGLYHVLVYIGWLHRVSTVGREMHTSWRSGRALGLKISRRQVAWPWPWTVTLLWHCGVSNAEYLGKRHNCQRVYATVWVPMQGKCSHLELEAQLYRTVLPSKPSSSATRFLSSRSVTSYFYTINKSKILNDRKPKWATSWNGIRFTKSWMPITDGRLLMWSVVIVVGCNMGEMQ